MFTVHFSQLNYITFENLIVYEKNVHNNYAYVLENKNK